MTIRIAITGVGNRALPKKLEGSNWWGWVELIRRTDGCELVAAHDPSDDARRRVVERGYLSENRTYSDLLQMIKSEMFDALLVTSPAEHHASAINLAIKNGKHVLVEKPAVPDFLDGKHFVQDAESAGLVIAVAQNWRTKDVGQCLRQAIQEEAIGRVGHVFFRYVRDRENPKYPAYIFEENYPLLYAMGIHHLDLIRYVLNEEYDEVMGTSFKPPWSLYQSATGLDLHLRTKGGIRVVYTGTISSKNCTIPQESFLIEGEKGSLYNESEWSEPPLWFFQKGTKKTDLTSGIGDRSIFFQYNIADVRILENFRDAIKGKQAPLCSLSDALTSLMTLEACRIACETNRSVKLSTL